MSQKTWFKLEFFQAEGPNTDTNSNIIPWNLFLTYYSWVGAILRMFAWNESTQQINLWMFRARIPWPCAMGVCGNAHCSNVYLLLYTSRAFLPIHQPPKHELSLMKFSASLHTWSMIIVWCCVKRTEDIAWEIWIASYNCKMHPLGRNHIYTTHLMYVIY